MGDIADWMLDQALDAGEWFPARRSAYGPPVTCKHCGSRNVYWQRVKGGWQLKDKANLERHLCRQPEQPNAEGFDDVD
jgi:DNA-directed RNA polymerase subunit RPC12/RpoP